MIKILIIDDEPAASNMLHLLINKVYQQPKEVMVCNKPGDALTIIPYWQPSLLMLDIEMPEMNGFDLLNKIQQPSFDVVFTTAYDAYAIKAIRCSALDYLLKPIDATELELALEKHALRKQEGKQTDTPLIKNLLQHLGKPAHIPLQLALPSAEGTVIVSADTIVRLEALSNYTHFYFTNRKPLLVSRTMKEYEEMLHDQGFFRIHKSHMVNRQYVMEIKRDMLLLLTNGDTVPIARRKKELLDVMQFMSIGK